MCQPPSPQSSRFLQLSTAETSLLALRLLQLGSAAQTSISHNRLSFGCVITISVHVCYCSDRISAFLAEVLKMDVFLSLLSISGFLKYFLYYFIIYFIVFHNYKALEAEE